MNLEIDRLTQSIGEIENQLRERGDNLTSNYRLQDELQYYRDKLSSVEEGLVDKQTIHFQSAKMC